MESRSVEAIVSALNAANVRYLVAGGLVGIDDLRDLKQRRRGPRICWTSRSSQLRAERRLVSSKHDLGIWEQGWEGHDAGQRRRLARAPLPEKLRWLEKAHRLVLHSDVSRSSSAIGGHAESTPKPSP